MYGGRIVEQAPTSILFSRMQHPYTEALLRSIPRVENPSHTKLAVIGGRPPDLVNRPPGCAFAARCPYAQDDCREQDPILGEGPGFGHRFACFHPLGDKRPEVPVTLTQAPTDNGEEPEA
jgi:peptide/nickel transport system ATP-binding protein